MLIKTKRSNEVDEMAGRMLRAFRVRRGLSQTAVGDHLGVTFQQVQKYEKGMNRMGASRLAALASLLGVKVEEFFPKQRPIEVDAGESVMMESQMERRLIVSFRQLNIRQRNAVVQLAESFNAD